MASSCVWSATRTHEAKIDTENNETVEIDLNGAKSVPELVSIIISFTSQKAWRVRFCIGDSGRRLVKSLIREVTKRLNGQPNIVATGVQTKVIVVGDIHGQEWNLRAILSGNGLPSEHTKYIFNGDIVDRGPASVECILTILALKHEYPEFIFINRGNHETEQVNNENGFRREVRQRLDVEVYDAFSECFCSIPLGVIVESDKTRLLILHGGIPVPNNGKTVTLDELQDIKRNEEPSSRSSLLAQVLWNDPWNGSGIKGSNRSGWGYRFGFDITTNFLHENNLSGIFRSHEEIQEPFSVTHRNCLTLFSAIGHCARYLEIRSDQVFKVWTLSPSSECQEDPDEFKWLAHGRDNPKLPSVER